jgi:hypothetical protein
LTEQILPPGPEPSRSPRFASWRIIAGILLLAGLAASVVFLRTQDSHEASAWNIFPAGGKTGERGRTTRPAVDVPPPARVTTMEEMQRLIDHNRQLRITEFNDPSTTLSRKRELLEALINSDVDVRTLLSFIDSLPATGRSSFLAALGKRCAAESPDDFFTVFDRLPPGINRASVIWAGIEAFDAPNLKRLLDAVLPTSDQYETSGLAMGFYRLPAQSRLKPAEVLDLAQEVPAGDLKECMIYSAGVLSGSKTDTSDLIVKIRQQGGDPLVSKFAEGQLTQEMRSDPAAFLGSVSAAPLDDLTKGDMVRAFASQTAGQKEISETLELGGGLSGPLADVYYQQVGHGMAARDSMETSRVLETLSAGRPRDIMTAQLVLYLDSTGDADAASQWISTIDDEGIRQTARPKNQEGSSSSGSSRSSPLDRANSR